MNAKIHCTATWVCMCTNYQQTQLSGLIQGVLLQSLLVSAIKKVLPSLESYQLCFMKVIRPVAQKIHDYK